MTGMVITHTIRIGMANKNQYLRWVFEKHPKLVSNLATSTPSSALMHLKVFMLCSMSLGWSKNIILMNEIVKFFLKLFTNFLLMKNQMTEIKETIQKRMIGNNDNKNSLKTEFDSNGPLISLSVIKQSNERNVSDAPPSL